MKKRIFSTLLAALVCVSALSGCGKKADNGPTTSELMEQYSEVKTAELWLYGDLDSDKSNLCQRFNAQHMGTYRMDVTTFTEDEMTLEQFQKKLQGAMMGGKGPDLVVTSNPLLLQEYKAIEAGAFRAWDDMLAKWDAETYYPQMIDGSRSADGKCYVLPLTVRLEWIAATKDNAEKFGLSAQSFADFDALTDTILSLWDEIDAADACLANYSSPVLPYAVPSILDYHAGKTALFSEENQEWFQKWKEIDNREMMVYREYPDKTWDGFRALSDGDAVLYFFDDSELLNQMTGVAQNCLTAEEMEQLVLFPQRDIDGKVIATTETFALLPVLSENNEAVEKFVEYIVMESDPIRIMEMVSLGKEQTAQLSKVLSAEQYRTVSQLLDEPMRVICYEWEMLSFHSRIFRCFDDTGDYSFEDLETDINIYLSE